MKLERCDNVQNLNEYGVLVHIVIHRFGLKPRMDYLILVHRNHELYPLYNIYVNVWQLANSIYHPPCTRIWLFINQVFAASSWILTNLDSNYILIRSTLITWMKRVVIFNLIINVFYWRWLGPLTQPEFVSLERIGRTAVVTVLQLGK